MASKEIQDHLLFAAALGLSIGLLDAAYVLASNAHELDRIARIPAGVLAVAAVFCVAQLALAAGLAAALRRGEPDRSAVAAGTGVVLLVAFAVLEAPLSVRLGFSVQRAGSESQILAGLRLAFVSLSLLAAYGAAAAVRRLRPAARERLARAGLLAPALLAEVTLLLWVQKAYPHLRLRVIVPPVLAVLAATVLLAWGRAGRARATALLYAAAAVIVLGSAAGVWPGVSRAESASAATRHAVRHVVLVTVDTLRADALGSYGGPSGSTPALDRFAAEGIRFANAISPAPWTLPSLASILTGVSPEVHRFHFLASTQPGRGAEALPPLTNVGERMAQAGYATAAFMANPLVRPGTNISRGYDRFVLAPSAEPRSLGGRMLRRQAPDLLPTEKNARLVTAAVESWLAENARKDFFLWVHYFDPHTPYELPRDLAPKGKRPPRFDSDASLPHVMREPAELAWARDIYDREVRLTDDGIGKLFAALKRLGLYDDALIVFTSDHGEEFLDHGSIGHAHTLYQELLHVPLIVKMPARGAPAPRVVETVVDSTGITPTILETCRIPWDRSAMTSPPLTPLLSGPPPGAWPPVVSTGIIIREEKESVVFDGMKYIESLATGHEELYDLKRDAGETTSIAGASPAAVAAARELLRAHREAGAAVRARMPKSSGASGADRETVRQLKALGYVQ